MGKERNTKMILGYGQDGVAIYLIAPNLKPNEEICRQCEGTGKFDNGDECTNCEGEGTVYWEEEKDGEA